MRSRQKLFLFLSQPSTGMLLLSLLEPDPTSIATVAAVSANREVTLEPLRVRPASIATHGIWKEFSNVSSIKRPVVEKFHPRK
jgi:hypothetical protein